MHKKITIKDIAQAASVSPAIVSRVMNNDKTLSIRDETRKAVLNAIEEYDFRPNSMARGLRTQSSMAIGVVFPDIMNPFFTEIVKGLQEATNESGYSLILCDTNDEEANEKKYIELLDTQCVDGLLLSATYVEDQTISLLESRNIKYVMVNRASTNSTAPYVKTDDQIGASKAVQHLTELGHKHIAHIAGLLYTDTGISRLEGYRKTLKQLGIPHDPRYLYETKFDENGGYLAAKHFFSLDNPPTAIFACNDMCAIGALRALNELGIRVPEDVSIVGYNDIWIAPMLAPALTTVHMPLREMGTTAFHILHDMIQGCESIQKRVIMDTELIVRKSTARVKDLSHLRTFSKNF